MDNGFDYPNDLCLQNALWRRLEAIEILQIRLDNSAQVSYMIDQGVAGTARVYFKFVGSSS